MSMTDQTADLRSGGVVNAGQPWVGEPALAPVPRRRMRGLRINAIPTWPLVFQVGGGVGAIVGVYMQWGWAVTLIVGGLGAAVLGMLKEGGKI